MTARPTRRAFLQNTAATSAAAAALVATGVGGGPGAAARAAQLKPLQFRKALKFGMIREGGTIKEKFNLIKGLGFAGVEVDAPGGVDKQEALDASKATGIVIHGVVDSVHWGTRLSDPDPAVRDKGLQALMAALGECKFLGGSTVLLVPGKLADPKTENFDQCWDRSTEQVLKAVPHAKELGIHIAIEVVWNDFLTKPEQLVKYVDEFKTPTVGAYFDISNMIRYGTPPQDWIRALGKRMLKFDFKAYKHANFMNGTSPWVAIGEGDEPWAQVHKALADVGYTGWATSEVGAADKAGLKDIAQRMDKVLTAA